MPDFNTPVGRLVQGSLKLEQQKDMDTGQNEVNDDGSPRMGVFMALAFPKVLPNGQPNVEFDNWFANQIGAAAASSWPQLFPQGYQHAAPNRGCMHPQFSWKYQDGDGVNNSGQSVAGKAGFAGHHIVKFYTSYEFPAYYEGRFAQHEVIQNAHEVVKRGFWVRLFGEVKSNGASGTKKPGMSLYPKLLSFVQQADVISNGPDAAAAFGAGISGWQPPPMAGNPVPMPGAVPTVAVPQPTVAVPQPTVAVPQPTVAVPQPTVAVPQMVIPTAPVVVAQQPVYVVSAALAAQGITLEALLSQGWTVETAMAQGHVVRHA